jgi:hypothetical protein
VNAEPAERLPGPIDRPGTGEIEIHSMVEHQRLERRAGRAVEQQLDGELGQAFADDRLRRGDDRDGLFGQPAPTDQRYLLVAALGLVAGVRLVQREVQQATADRGGRR